jgi:hypothetical protein
MSTPCRVWQMFQARCLLCEWDSPAIYGVDGSSDAADDAVAHRASPEHQAALRLRRIRRHTQPAGGKT